MIEQRIVIIGGDAAGLSAAAQIKRIDPQALITVLEKKRYISYSNCSIPYILSGKITHMEELIHYTPERFEKEKGGNIITGAEVISCDFKGRSLQYRKDAKQEKLYWDKLIIATGGSYSKDENVGGIYTPTIEDYFIARKDIEAGSLKRALVVGAGLSGIETAWELKNAGVGVAVVEGERILPGFSQRVKDDVAELLQNNGIDLHENTFYHGFSGNTARTSLGEIECEAVFLSTGIKPNTEIFDIPKYKNGAIQVNGRMKTSIENVYAAGDCASYKRVGGHEQIYLPLGTYANRSGVIAGESACNMIGSPLEIKGAQVFTLGGFQCGRVGFWEMNDTVSQYSESQEAGKVSGKGIVKLMLYAGNDGIIKGGEFWGEGDALRRIYLISAMLRHGLNDLIALDLPYTPLLSSVKDITINAALRLKAKIDRYNS